jgi:hypothetical protein
MSKSNPEEEKQLNGPGWTSYQPIPDDWDEDEFTRSQYFNLPKLNPLSRLNKWCAKKLYENRYSKMIKVKTKHYFDFGDGDYGHLNHEEMYLARAAYLLKHRWIQLNFGCFIVEYSILNGYGSFRYSHNDGIEFHKHSETRLSKHHQLDLEILTTFFIEAEEHLYASTKDRKPTYYPLNLFL